MKRAFRLVTFDFYTALVDYEATVVPALAALLDGKGDAADVARAWRAKQLEWALLSNSLSRGRIPFRECTRRALVHVLARLRIRPSDVDVARLVRLWDRPTPWPEASAALAEVKSRGYAIALLSNGDEAMLRTGAEAFGVEFEHILASDQAGFYKPHPGMYALPAVRLGMSLDDVLHVAGSGNDAMGARLAGLRCAWSNRKAEPPADESVRADYEIANLSGLMTIL